jgi:hypothetical protein
MTSRCSAGWRWMGSTASGHDKSSGLRSFTFISLRQCSEMRSNLYSLHQFPPMVLDQTLLIIALLLVSFCELKAVSGALAARSYTHKEKEGFDMYRRVVRWKWADVSEEHVAFIFKVEETSVKAGGKQDFGESRFLRNVGWLSKDYRAFISQNVS